MFFRQKKSGERVYLQIVENRWEQGRSKQRVIATLGRLDRLSESGQLDALLQSGAKFSESVMVLAAHREGEAPVISTRRIGPADFVRNSMLALQNIRLRGRQVRTLHASIHYRDAGAGVRVLIISRPRPVFPLPRRSGIY